MMRQLADYAAQLAADLISSRWTPRNVDRHGLNAKGVEVAAKRTANLSRGRLLVAAEANLQLARRRLRHLEIVNARLVFHHRCQCKRHDGSSAAAGQWENQRLIGPTLNRHYGKPATASARRIAHRDRVA